MKLLILNGPNLNLLGQREPGIYGELSFEEFLPQLKAQFPSAEMEYYQTNVEGEMINKLQEADQKFDGVILNAGGYTHTSVAIGDAIRAIKTPVIEVHISNIMAREEFRQRSMISGGVRGIISGFGMNSYKLAVSAFMEFR